jgi:nitrogen regulatory protein PII 1
MIRAVVRPEKTYAVMTSLLDAGFPGVTKIDVFGRGKQRGLKVGEVTYNELPKDMLMVVVPDPAKNLAVEAILEAARSSAKGSFGDGKIFVSHVEESYTISSGLKD